MLPNVCCVQGPTREENGWVATLVLFVGNIICALLVTIFYPYSPKLLRSTALEMIKSPRRCLDTSIPPLPFEISSCALAVEVLFRLLHDMMLMLMQKAWQAILSFWEHDISWCTFHITKGYDY